MEKFIEYGIDIITQRMLSDGEYIMHFELTPLPIFFIDARFDAEVKFLTSQQMDELLQLEIEVK